MSKYDFSLDLIEIDDTRSRHEDTVFASASVAVAGRDPVTRTEKLGDHNNGSFNTGIVLPHIPIADDEVAVFSYVIVNNGHTDENVVKKTITDAAVSLAKKGADAAIDVAATAVGGAVGAAVGALLGTTVPIVGTIVGGALGALGGKLMGDLINVINPNCDGPVASAVIPITGLNLRRKLDAGQHVGHRDYNPGIDSPGGCGSNSRYHTTWSVRKSFRQRL